MGRVGRWCFRHWAWVLLIWAAVVAGGVAATGPLFERLGAGGVPPSAESVAAYEVLNEGNGSAGTIVAVVDGVDPAAGDVRAAVTATAARVAGIAGVAAVDHPFDPRLPPPAAGRLVARDGRAVLVAVTLTAMERAGADATARAVADELHRLADALPPPGTVEVGGGPVQRMQVNQAVQRDLQRAELISLPLTLVVLILVFRGLVAAGLPVLTAAVSVAAAMAALLGFSTFTEVDTDGVTVVTLLGLGLSVDYGLLLVARYREELLRGFAPDVAVARAWATAGRTILFSALTVAAALSGLLMFELPALRALGSAGVSIAVVCMLGSLTFAAALIGMLRRWIRPSRRERRALAAGTLDGTESERGFFARLGRFVQRRPLLVAALTTAALLAAGTPLLTAGVRLPGLEGLPRSIEAVRVADDLASRFGRPAAPGITVVVRGDAATLDTWAAGWRGEPAVAVIRPAEGRNSIASVAIDLAGDPQGPAARDLVERMRADRPPATESWVTGNAAVLIDLLGIIRAGLPAALAVTLLAMIALLFAMTGSVVVPVKAILANIVSLGATFGVLAAVFGEGFGADLLDTLTVGALSPFVSVAVFAFAFGLSMDYELFLLGRVKEYVDAGTDTDTAVRRGLQHTGRTITSAALLMVAVFACFAAAEIGNVEQVGLGLSVAVLIDATIVRCLLVPATMTLLGRWNWWAPAWLARLHARFGLRDARLPEPETERERVLTT
jgi:RND superfamily putative drug exporter